MSALDDNALEISVHEWLRRDKFTPNFRSEIESLWADKNTTRLHKLLGERMEFGTAGLRSSMGPGYSQMNMVTVIQTSQGLARYVLESHPDARTKGVVIGHDARHHSPAFARAAAAAFAKVGFERVLLLDGFVHTPMVPHTVVRERCSVGVMVTASHNPKNDNGYKVYWDNGAQIRPPLDSHIANSIADNLEIRISESDIASVQTVSDTAERIQHYVKEAAKALHTPHSHGCALTVTYTAMHGVGYRVVKEMFDAFGLQPLVGVPEQIEPDPEFPTVILPNPEEGKGALVLAMATADRHGSRLIVANDPDADRLAAAEKNPETGQWHIFKGDEIGILLADWRLTTSSCPKDKIAFLNTTVSSRMLKALAEKEGVLYDATPTGFKYLGNRSLELTHQGYHVLLAYEEAIGYMLNVDVPDKDGVSGAAVFVEMANDLESRGLTVAARLEQLKQKYGYFVTNNSYYICREKTTIAQIFERLRNGGKYMDEVEGCKINHIWDATLGVDTSAVDQRSSLPVQQGQMITYYFENGSVLTLRTSGTEPKIKYYSEASSAVSAASASTLLTDTLTRALPFLLQPQLNNLTVPPQ